jgi:outer membrane protein assembly factor BamB
VRVPILSAILSLCSTLASGIESPSQPTAQPRLRGDDWPCWRGPTSDNHSIATNPPVEWSVTKNIAWNVEVPGRGHASPSVVGDKIFIASADESAETQFLLCYDRVGGKQLWKVDLHHRPFPAIHKNNSHASATPACDGQAVYTAFVSGGELTVSSVSLDGKTLWQKSAGQYQHANGFGASPVLYDHLIVVASDNQIEPSLVALDRLDGRAVWRTLRPKSDNSATPVVAVVAGRPQLLLNGARLVASYDPLNGNELWHVTHNTEVAACTMAFDESSVFASGNVPEKNLLCIRANGHGDVGESQVRWKTNQLVTYVPSPLAVDGYLFAVTDSGLAWCRDTATGDVIWKERLGGTFFSSPVLAARMIYATNDAGVTYVFRAGPKFEQIAVNDVEETCMATPAICGTQIFLRTATHLFCIGGSKP